MVRDEWYAQHSGLGHAPAKSGEASQERRLVLKPCPHCGAKQLDLNKAKGKGIYAYNDSPSGDSEQWIHVACLECGSGSPSVEVWNKRHKQ